MDHRDAWKSTRANNPIYPPLPASDRRSPSPDADGGSSRPKEIRMNPLTQFDSTRRPAETHRGPTHDDASSFTFKDHKGRLRCTDVTDADPEEPNGDRTRLIHQSDPSRHSHRDRSASPEARGYRKSGEHRVCDPDAQGHRSPKAKHRSSESPSRPDRVPTRHDEHEDPRVDRFRFKERLDDDDSTRRPDSQRPREEDSSAAASSRLDRFRFSGSISPERTSRDRVPESPSGEHSPPTSSFHNDRRREGDGTSSIADSIRGLSVARRPERDHAPMNPVFMDGDDGGIPLTKGSPFETIVSSYHLPTRLKPMESMNDRNIHFMIRPFNYDPSQPDQVPKPINDRYIDTWNANHVRMPCSPSYYGHRRNHIWPLIEQTVAFLRGKCEKKVATFETLAGTLQRCAGSPLDLKSLEILINEKLTDDERTNFMTKTLPKMCNLVLNVSTICSMAPPFLRVGSNASVTMSQLQASSLLACAFFLTFPSRSHQKPGSPCEHFPDPNFTRLYQGGVPTKVEKLRCLLHYFERVTEKEPTGVLTFRRSVLEQQNLPQWKQSNERLTKLHVSSAKKIEEFGGVLQVDFANKYIGGGVLGRGCVQEEIRFTICPEMIISLLLCERMEDNECIFLIGCEQYSTYTGYADSFKFAGDFVDRTQIDSWSRRCSHVVGMDAILYRNRLTQYQGGCIQRELVKAFVGFLPVENVEAVDQSAVATGNWGCGAFNGDRRLKALIQLVAASEAGRTLVYAAYRDRTLVQELWDIYSYFTDNNATVGDVYKYLEKYSNEPEFKQHIFDFIRKTPIEQIRSS